MFLNIYEMSMGGGAPSDEQSSDMRTGFGAVPLKMPLYAGFCTDSMRRFTRSSLHPIKGHMHHMQFWVRHAEGLWTAVTITVGASIFCCDYICCARKWTPSPDEPQNSSSRPYCSCGDLFEYPLLDIFWHPELRDTEVR